MFKQVLLTPKPGSGGSCEGISFLNIRWGLLIVLGLFVGVSASAEVQGKSFYVSVEGRDTWSGRFSEPNQDRTDGPFASLARARDAVRVLKADTVSPGPITVQVRGGQYFLNGPIRFGVEDSGCEAAPISYQAYPGETPEFIGGRRLTLPTKTGGGPMVFSLPQSENGPWTFRSLFVDGRREVRARYPNVDGNDPIRKGFLYAVEAPGQPTFGATVGGIHNVGDWLEYRVNIPTEGDYHVWMHYGALNAPYGLAAMDGRTSLLVDGHGPHPLTDLSDTGAWNPTRWGRAARLHLTAGEHQLRWQNQKGGGLVLDALALCNNASWKPEGINVAPPERGHLVTVSANRFVRSHGRQITVSGGGSGPKNAIWCGPDDVRSAWLSAPDAEVHIFQSGDCRAFSEILSIVSYDANERRLQLGGPEAHSALNPGDRYYVENVKEELDAPGEWFLDSKAGTLTYFPRVTFTPRSEVLVPMTTRLLQVEGQHATRTPVRHLRFAGLTFRNTDWNRGGASAGYGVGDDGAIYLREAEACVVEDCRFINLGTYAVCMAKGRGNIVRGCEVAHAGGGGVLIMEGVGNQVIDNHLHHLGEAYQHVGGVVLAGAGASDNMLAHNAIHDVSRYGISLKEPGQHNVVEFNRIQNTNLETSDSGGIEVTQHDRAFRSGSIIRNNQVADTIGYSSTFGEPVYMSWGIYLDSFASGYEVSGNVVCRTYNGGIMLQGGRDNRVMNNIFVDGQVSQGSLANFEHQSQGLHVTSNIFAFSAPDAVVFETGDLGPDVIRVDRNLYFPPRSSPPTFASSKASTFAEWRRQGRDAASVVADPRFRLARPDDYVLQSGSPAFRLGFPVLPLEQIGPRTGKCTCQIHPAGQTFWNTHTPTLSRVAKKTHN
jgi:parallel beta-helix repeat protein